MHEENKIRSRKTTLKIQTKRGTVLKVKAFSTINSPTAKIKCASFRKTQIRKIYLDSNILIAFYSSSREEDPKRRSVIASLEKISLMKGVKLFTSSWAITEMVNILISRHKMRRVKVGDIETALIETERLEHKYLANGMKIRIIDASPKEDYTVREYIFDVRRSILKYHSGVGDCMHWVYIDNNKINTILTFDAKQDFKKIPGLNVIDPLILQNAKEEGTQQ